MIKCHECGVVIEVFKDLEDFVEVKSGLPADQLHCGESAMLCDECGEKSK